MAATPAPASSRDNVVGIVLIVGAVLIGVLLLAKGYDAEGGVVAATGDDSASATSSTVPVDSTTTTIAAVASLPPAEVPVKVANASGASGVAGSTRDTLLEKGYVNVAISDAPSLVPTTQVLFVAGSEGEARAVAEALGLDPATVQPVQDPPPVALDGAVVLVLAGPDLV
jgi:hypothetical protein